MCAAAIGMMAGGATSAAPGDPGRGSGPSEGARDIEFLGRSVH